MFYIVRLFIYNAESSLKPEPDRSILQNQFNVMIKRLWYGITWPSAILTLVFGGWMWYLLNSLPNWLAVKLILVVGLYVYHFSLHSIFTQQMSGEFRFTSQNLRIWNEVATIFLVAIVMLAVVKQELSFIWGLAGLLLFIVALLSAIRIYKLVRR